MQYALTKYPQAFFTAPEAPSSNIPAALQGQANGHDILYWVNKDNPLGGGNSMGDGQFPYWEYPIGSFGISSTTGSTTETTTTTVTTDSTDTTNTNNSTKHSPRSSNSSN